MPKEIPELKIVDKEVDEFTQFIQSKNNNELSEFFNQEILNICVANNMNKGVVLILLDVKTNEVAMSTNCNNREMLINLLKNCVKSAGGDEVGGRKIYVPPIIGINGKEIVQ